MLAFSITYTSSFRHKNVDFAKAGFCDNALLEITEMEERYGAGRYNIGIHVQEEIYSALSELPTQASVAAYIVELVRKRESASIQVAWSWASNRMPSVTQSKIDSEFSMDNDLPVPHTKHDLLRT